jgi:CRP-like cAMP-binding protein
MHDRNPAPCSAQFLSDCFQHYNKQKVSVAPNLLSLFRLKTYKKGEPFVRAGEHWNSFSIIIKGIFRLYYLDKEGTEHTKGIFWERMILAPCAPSAIGQPISFHIESFGETKVYTANYNQVREILESTAWGTSVLIGMLESILEEKVEREYIWLNLDAEERYLRFVSKNPRIAARIPLYIIANYLGMTDVTLSRIRKGLKEDANKPG